MGKRVDTTITAGIYDRLARGSTRKKYRQRVRHTGTEGFCKRSDITVKGDI